MQSSKIAHPCERIHYNVTCGSGAVCDVRKANERSAPSTYKGAIG